MPTGPDDSRPAPAAGGASPLRPAGIPGAGPVGVFDSGIGGLSVLRHIRAHLPREDLIYIADSGFAPYGDKSEQQVVARSLAIAEFLLQQGAKALVVACNTATAAAIGGMRLRYPGVPVVGVEPGLKPAAARSAAKTVGVLATARTLASEKFTLLREQITQATSARFLLQPCIGLADQVEKGELRSAATAALVQRYVQPLVAQGADTLVLGCTHYPFVQPLIEAAARRAGSGDVAIIDTGEAVARQLGRLLEAQGLRNPGHLHAATGTLRAYTTGSRASLAQAFARLLKLDPPVAAIATAATAPAS